MNNKTYSKIRRKKSFASFILAFLLMFTFNSSPIMWVANNARNARNANALKSSETKTFYTSKTNESESKFADPQYPKSYLEYFEGSNKNFDILDNYKKEFEVLYLKYADDFFKSYDEVYEGSAYNTDYQKFLDYYGAISLSDFFTSQKDSSLLKANLKEITAQELIAHLGIKGFDKYDGENSLPALSKKIALGKYINLSNFYRLFANVIAEDDINAEAEDTEESPNWTIETDEAFYRKPTPAEKKAGTKVGNSHYNRLVEFIDKEYLKTAPTYAFDNETQSTKVAAIIANNAPTSVSYNYVSNSYKSYTEPNESYSREGTTKVVYGFEDIDRPSGVVAADKDIDTILLYRPILSGPGYHADYKTYNKYTSSPYDSVSYNGTAYLDVYVLTDSSTTQDDLDTIKSVHFKTLTEDVLNDNKEYYVNIPYESDELYFEAIYKKHLYSTEGFFGGNENKDMQFETFVKTFTKEVLSSKVSQLYLKIKATSSKNVVFIDEGDLAAFNADEKTADYPYRIETFKKSDVNMSDYEEITRSGSKSAYWRENHTLYLLKTKEYYTDGETNTYGTEYETTSAAKIPLEKEWVASNNYEPVAPDSSERKIYILSDSDEATETIKNIDESQEYTFPVVKQTTIDADSSYYVPVPSFVYKDKEISDTYKLYYKHTSVEKVMLFIVDDSDNASDNAIYKTLNFNVISSSELKANITNYIAVKESDSNYNKDFQLYYKYRRTVVTSEIYVLDKPGVSLGTTDYKLVFEKDISDYALIDKTTESAIYETVKTALPIDPNLDIDLYYKKSSVYVQNHLRGGNAIYVLDPGMDKDEKVTYTKLMYTHITQSEIDKNPSLYVLIDSNDESNYFADYKLYYKYQTEEPTKTVYAYENITQTTKDFDKNAYELITSGPDYIEGQELYYKKKIIETTPNNITKPTFYYYQTTSTTTLSANSYYVVSFYVNTIGTDARASLSIKDTASVINDINVNNINTDGKWEKYYVYLSTNASTSSTINITLYMGDEVHGIKGNTSSDTISGSVFFDDIKITKIGLTDYTKRAIDAVEIEKTLYKYDDDSTVDGEYADEYNNRAYVANDDPRFDSERLDADLNDKWDARRYLNVNAYNGLKWNDIFNFDNTSVQSYLGKETAEPSEKIENQLAKPQDKTDGFSMYDSNFNTIWKYYISRDLENDFTIDHHIKAYQDGKLEVTTTNQIEESETPDEEEKEDDKKDEEENKDITYVSSPFNRNNYALKLKNTSKDTALGITSNSFVVKQFEYYKITLWIYSPDLEGKATISVNSVLTDRQHPTYGSLLSSSINSTYANIEESSTKSEEYGWIPVSLYIEGNNFQDMNCYLVLTAEKDCTVYFDNIRIEKTTSSQYDSAKSSGTSDKYTCALSLTPSSSLISSDITNGTFDYVKETSTDHDITSETPYAADSWTVFTGSSSRAIAGIVSLQQTAFFDEYSRDKDDNIIKPTEYTNDISNIFAIHAPSTITPMIGTDIDYKHTYSIYSSSMSLTANALYKISFKFFKNDNFTGKIFSNIYGSAVKVANVFTSLEVDESNFADEQWHTLTFYIATSTSSQTVYIEIGVKDAQETCFFKSVSAKKLTGKTISSVIQSEAIKNNIDLSSTPDNNIFDAFKTVRFVDLSNNDFSNHTSNLNTNTNLFDPKPFTNESSITKDHTAGQIGVTVASYYDTINHSTYSVTIDKITYYVGEVYEVEVDTDTKYYIHRTYNSSNNEFNYKLYSDSELKNELTQIDGKDFEITTTGAVKLVVNSDPSATYETKTTYRLFKFSDLREEVTEISGSDVSVPNLENVVVGTGSHATETAIISSQTTSYIYNFETTTKSDIEINNNIISSEELRNNQSANVLILSNSHSTDYISLKQASTRTLGKSTFNVLRIYVKTSNFSSDSVGLNISVPSVNVEWTNINTTKSEKTDKYGFVCYEVLISSNSVDSISNFGVELSLGNKDNSEVGYAIISEISVETLANKEIFEHYSSLVGDDNENIKKAIYTDKASTTTDSSKDKESDDDNSMSWATFFYIFSSILLVVTMAVAMVAILLKKHPIKLSEKFENEHERDIQTTKSKDSKAKKDEIIIDLSNNDKKKSNKNDGEII